MYTSPNLGLSIWDQTRDDFDHSQLQNNWLAIDQHDHSNGRGVQIGTGGIQPLAITAALIALAAVGNAQLAAGAVGTTNIEDAAVTNGKVAPGAIFGNLIPPGAIVGPMLDSTLIPLGGSMLWWRPPGTAAVPGGWWEAMDGRAWSSITNAWNLTTGNIPDTRGAFVKGADTLAAHGPAIGATGGSASLSLAHSHNVLGHTHTTPGHTHGITSDGQHLHTWAGGLHMATRTNCLPIGMTVQGAFGGSAQDTFYSMYVQNLLSNPAWLFSTGGGTEQVIDGVLDMDQAGSHGHGGATQSGGSGATGSAASTTDSQLGSQTIDPPWTGLLYIMRCR